MNNEIMCDINSSDDLGWYRKVCTVVAKGSRKRQPACQKHALADI